ncbi:MAG TPA: competence protein ComK [Acholeplasmataceae bacterium]|jgi:competence transcription factor ComK|nr:hypothetical protein [Acholeplasmataceae bacterium]HPX71689.1 competence protein ComK [Acholeplasmataceae bacterium]HQC30702.1 competence protein ComK [Acholeplasmataceae bacterium]
MIKYIVNTSYGSKIIKLNQIEESKLNNLSIIKKLFIENLCTYEGYIKAVSKTFNIKHNIPVVINKDNLFIPLKRVRDYDNIWINYASIITYKQSNNMTTIIFSDYEELIINLKYSLFIKRVKILEKIIRYKQDKY